MKFHIEIEEDRKMEHSHDRNFDSHLRSSNRFDWCSCCVGLGSIRNVCCVPKVLQKLFRVD